MGIFLVTDFSHSLFLVLLTLLEIDYKEQKCYIEEWQMLIMQITPSRITLKGMSREDNRFPYGQLGYIDVIPEGPLWIIRTLAMFQSGKLLSKSVFYFGGRNLSTYYMLIHWFISDSATAVGSLLLWIVLLVITFIVLIWICRSLGQCWLLYYWVWCHYVYSSVIDVLYRMNVILH